MQRYLPLISENTSQWHTEFFLFQPWLSPFYTSCFDDLRANLQYICLGSRKSVGYQSITHKRNASVTIGAALIFSRKISWELILFSLSCRQLSRFKASLNISNYEPYGGSIRKFLLHREESQFFFFSSLFSLLSSLFSFFFYCLFMTFFIFC